MSFNFNGQVFEVVEKRGKKTVMKEKKDYWEKTREETFSYNLLSLLNTTYGRELVAKAQEALRIDQFIFVHDLDDHIEPAKENIYKCFKDIDIFLDKTFEIKEKQQ